MEKKTILRWLKGLIIMYCTAGIALYYLQDLFLFHPKQLPASYTYHFDMPFEEMNIPFNKSDTISLIKFLPYDSVRKGVVLYFHANRQNVEKYAKFAHNFTSHGYEVWMEDYPGYGKSVGERSEKRLYEQAVQIQKMALGKYPGNRIIIYGRSIGTGIAAYLASVTDCKRLILETPYYSIPDLYDCFIPIYPSRLMATYEFPVYRFLKDVNFPVSIFHGTNDWVVPYFEAVKLSYALKPGDELITIKKGGHLNLNDFTAYHQKLDSILALP